MKIVKVVLLIIMGIPLFLIVLFLEHVVIRLLDKIYGLLVYITTGLTNGFIAKVIDHVHNLTGWNKSDIEKDIRDRSKK